MDITINESLKRLRTARGSTQDALAAHCGVTTQAVSKWERGERYPDITLLPKIAAYYGVTVDELLGVGEKNKQQRVAEILKLEPIPNVYGITAESREMIRAARRDFPNDFQIANMYMNMSNYTHPLDDMIAVAELLLNSPEHRNDAVMRLCYAWLQKGDREKAKMYAKMYPAGHTSMSMELSVLEGEDLRRSAQLSLVLGMLDLSHILECLIPVSNLTPDEQIRAWEVVTNLYDNVYYEDGGFGDNLNIKRVHMAIAKLCAETHDTENMFAHIKKARDHARSCDRNDAGDYKSPLARGQSYTRNGAIYGDGRPQESVETEEVLRELADPVFDFVRDDPEFIALLR
ncbi:MAG: helix-turn-helix domain-containing protein [Oscillospiraceae bacterium]|jgi:transcriptional regulator with XRE-family HTH domain|nr:helix-turn-helix domain-containing protein [Oscillospiraceae bacterium]